jgi:hypothetical protein
MAGSIVVRYTIALAADDARVAVARACVTVTWTVAVTADVYMVVIEFGITVEALIALNVIGVDRAVVTAASESWVPVLKWETTTRPSTKCHGSCSR